MNIETFSLPVRDPNEKNFAALSKVEILEKLKNKSAPEGRELIKSISSKTYWPPGIDEDLIKEQKGIRSEVLQHYGPKVGTVEVKSRNSNQMVRLSLHCKRRIFNPTGKYEINEDGEMLEVGAPDPKQNHYICEYFLVDDKGNIAGSMELEDYSSETLSHLKDIQRNLLNYSGDINENPTGFTYVSEMGGGGAVGYRGCGTVLHQIAVEHSIRNGFEGRVQLLAAGFGSSGETPIVTSVGFHESFGYLYKDVFDKDGVLHHKGSTAHEALAKSRWEEAEKYRREHPDESRPSIIKDSYRPTSDAGLYAYLPEEIILREKERMLSHQNLRPNLETLSALESAVRK